MGTLNSFALTMDKLREDLPNIANEAAIDIAAAILSDMLTVTPVDTSKAVSNWQIGLGTPYTVEREPYYKGRRGSTRLVSSNAALKDGVLAIQQKKPGEPLYISNSAHYIEDLNDRGNFTHRAALIAKLNLRNV
jgi:hypothetical protein